MRHRLGPGPTTKRKCLLTLAIREPALSVWVPRSSDRSCGCRESYPGTVSRNFVQWSQATKLGHGPVWSPGSIARNSCSRYPDEILGTHRNDRSFSAPTRSELVHESPT